MILKEGQMKNILLPTDFSKCSLNAIHYALDFFRGESCTFHLLSIYKTGEYTSGKLWLAGQDESIYDSLLGRTKQQMKDLVEELKNNSLSEKFTFTSVTGYNSFTAAINKTITEKDIDLIIMGTAGAKGALESLFGQHTLKVIREVNSPLLVIPSQCRYSGLNRAMMSLQEDIGVHLESFLPLLRLISHRQFSLQVIRMASGKKTEGENQQEERELREVFPGLELEYHRLIDVQHSEAVKTLVQVMEPDIHVLPVKKEDFLERIFGSALANMVYVSCVPLFILHERRGLQKHNPDL